jgi:hypothetical protein
LSVPPILIVSIAAISRLGILLIVWWLAVGCLWLLGPCRGVLPSLVACLSRGLLRISCLPIRRRWILSCSSCCCGWLSSTRRLWNQLTCATVCCLRGRVRRCVAWMHRSAIPSCRSVLCLLGCTIEADGEKYTRYNLHDAKDYCILASATEVVTENKRKLNMGFCYGFYIC